MKRNKLTKEQVLSIPRCLKIMTHQQLANEWEVHVQTIRRWVRKLRDRGIKVPSYKGSVGLLDK